MGSVENLPFVGFYSRTPFFEGVESGVLRRKCRGKFRLLLRALGGGWVVGVILGGHREHLNPFVSFGGLVDFLGQFELGCCVRARV